MRSEPARQLADDLWLLDTFYQGEPGVIASYLLTGASGAALVDVGSAASLEQLLAGLRAAGVAPREVRHIVLTHVHLDHAGAAGALLPYCPDARVYAHPLGAPHLADPTKLIASAGRIYGDQMRALWGDVTSVPPARIVPLADGAEIQVGGRTLRALHTPGHAVHHIAYHDFRGAEVFAGDAAGVRLEGIPLVRPPTPPPDLLLEDWYDSIARIMALEPKRMFLAHYGTVHTVREHLAELRARLAQWGDAMLSGIRRGLDDDALAEELAALSAADLAAAAGASGAATDELKRRYELAANYRMSAQGYVRYFRKHHPELLA